MFFLSLLSSTSPIPFDDRRDIISERERIVSFNEYDHAYSLSGAVELVAHLKRHNIPQAVATSSQMVAYKTKTSKHEWFSHFDHIVVGDDPLVKKGKVNTSSHFPFFPHFFLLLFILIFISSFSYM